MEREVYKPLRTYKMRPGTQFHLPANSRRVRADSPAIEVMTDLREVLATTIAPDATLEQATQLMVARRVRLLLVVQKGEGLVGLITARDTMGERPINMIRERGGRHCELTVRDLMIPCEQIDVIAYDSVVHAELGHVVATLKHFGRQHALVVDTNPFSGQEMVRGIFSATEVGRQLGMALQPFEVARTFAEIEAELAKDMRHELRTRWAA